MTRRGGGDRGVALPMVILIGFMSVLLIGTALTAASSGLRQSVTSQRSTSALDAAFAGVQDYLARVNADDSYVKYGNALAPFTIASGSALKVTATTDNPAMGSPLSWGWATVPGSGGSALFRYEVDNSTYKTTGIIRLRVTGAAGDRTRTLLVSLRVRGFVDFSYFTDLEMQDPDVSGDPQSCAVRYPRPSSCTAAPLRFSPSDVISGDVHSNDRMIICATTFTGHVTTYYSGSPLYGTEGCSKTAAETVTHADELTLPATNNSMKTDAGCLYSGPTQVTYNGDGTMTVVSPWTRITSDIARCGNVSSLNSTAGATVPQLDHDALYVESVPSTDPTDPNYYSTSTKPGNVTCLDINGNTSTSFDGPGWSMGSGATVIRHPLTNEVPSTIKFATATPTWSTSRPAYGCRNGDLFVQGQVTVQTTAASQNYVYITDNLTYADSSNDVLGVVGQNGVIVWNPMKSYPSDPDNPYRPILTDSRRDVYAAVLAVSHTFSVQNFDRGTSRGTLHVFGSIGQRFRGAVATSGDFDTGYVKAYEYDTLLKTVSPPKFLAAGSTTFTVTYYASVPAAFDSKGNAL